MIFVITEIVCISTGTSSDLRKKRKTGKESQNLVSHPELGLDPPIGSDWESGRDNKCNIKKKKPCCLIILPYCIICYYKFLFHLFVILLVLSDRNKGF